MPSFPLTTSARAPHPGCSCAPPRRSSYCLGSVSGREVLRRPTCGRPELESGPEQQLTDPAADAAATESTDPTKPKRRRGSRGGRGRKKPGATSTAGAAAETATAPEREGRRQAAARAPALPAAGTPPRPVPAAPPPRAAAPRPASGREARAARLCRRRREACRRLEDGKPPRSISSGRTPLDRGQHLSRSGRQRPAGNGGGFRRDRPREERLPLRRRDRRPGDRERATAARSRTSSSAGKTILVQAVKDPMKTKGARLTTQISLPGRFVVLVPQGEGLGVSRRLDDDERNRLKDILKRLNVKEGGVIVRTAAEGASEEDIERDLVFLQRLWKSIQAQAKTAKAPTSSTRRPSCRSASFAISSPATSRRRTSTTSATHKRIVGYLKKTRPHGRARRPLRGEACLLMEAFGVEQEIRRRSAVASTFRPAAISSSTTPRRSPYRRQHRPLRRRPRQELGQPARGHDHEEQPRGGEGGRPPAAAARHRRDHRHRLHRHGESEEPRHGRGGAALGARARPHEDVRRRDLAARARRDDPAERDRRPARRR